MSMICKDYCIHPSRGGYKISLRIEERVTEDLAIRGDLPSSKVSENIYDAVVFADSQVGRDFSASWRWGNELYYLNGISYRQLLYKRS